MHAACTVCQSTRTVDRTLVHPDGRTLPVRICNDCGYGVRNDQRDLSENLRKQVEYFDAAVKPPTAPARWPNRNALLADEIGRLVPRPGRMLDIGCGPGAWLQVLGQRGWELHGVEVAPAVAEVARKHVGADVFCGALEEYEAPPGSFDLICAFALIEHLSDPRVLIDWVHMHLRTGGLFVVMTGDRDSAHGRQAGDRWGYYWNDEHVSFFSGPSLVRLIAAGGFEVVRQEWRYSGWRRGREPLTRVVAKLREICRLTTAPRYDHAYVYARKRG